MHPSEAVARLSFAVVVVVVVAVNIVIIIGAMWIGRSRSHIIFSRVQLERTI